MSSGLIINPNLLYTSVFGRDDIDKPNLIDEEKPLISIPKRFFNDRGKHFIKSLYEDEGYIPIKIKFPDLKPEDIRSSCNVSEKYARDLCKQYRERWIPATMSLTDEDFKYVRFDYLQIIFTGEPIKMVRVAYMPKEDMKNLCIPDGTIVLIRL